MCRSLKRSRKLWNLIVYKGLKGKKIVVSEATTSKESISTSFLQFAFFLSNFLFRYLLLHLRLTKLSRIDCPSTNPKRFDSIQYTLKKTTFVFAVTIIRLVFHYFQTHILPSANRNYPVALMSRN